MKRLLTAAAALLGLPTSAAVAACVIGRLAELPVTMSDLRPTIHARINGQDVRLLADSGAFFSGVTPGMAAELNLKTRPAPFGFYVKGFGGLAEASITTARTFMLDTIPLSNVDFIVAGNEIDQHLAGMLGRNVLSYADTEYDLANGAIRLMRPSGCGERPLSYWAPAKPYSVLDILPEVARYPPVMVPVFVNGVRLRALMDTGAPISLLGAAAARRAGVVAEGASATVIGGGVGRRFAHDSSGTVASVKIGDEEVKNTRLNLVDTDMDTQDMVLGMDFFLSHRVFVAKDRGKVYFTYNGGPVFAAVVTPADAPLAAAGPDAVEPADAAGFSRRGGAYASRRDFAHAMADLDRAVALSPTNADYVQQRAMAHLAAGQMSLAMADLDQALKLRPDDLAALETRAQLRLAGNDRSEALKDLDAAARLAPKPADIRLRLAGDYERAEVLDAAVDQYDLWITAHPDDARRPQALNGRCWARALAGVALDRALADCDAAHRLQPKDAAILDSRGLVHLRRGEPAKAIADYDAALAINPRLAWSLLGRGLAKQKLGQADAAKADLAAAVAARPGIAAEAVKHGIGG